MPPKKKTVLCTGECNEEKKIACFRRAWAIKKNYGGWVCIVCEEKRGRSGEEMEADDSADEEMEGQEEGADNFAEEPAAGVGGAHGATASRPKRKKTSSTSVEVCACVCSLSSPKSEFTQHLFSLSLAGATECLFGQFGLPCAATASVFLSLLCSVAA
jgi:hypothetical protein